MRKQPQAREIFSFVVDGECEIWYLQMLQKNENLLKINIEPKLPQRKKMSDQFKMVEIITPPSLPTPSHK